MPSHLQSARQEIAESPTLKRQGQLDEFLEAELSQEPQIGFIIGVGANDVTGVLLPIATSLTYGLSVGKGHGHRGGLLILGRRPRWRWRCR
jgi:transitional endoplasmic reticulum ATPase